MFKNLNHLFSSTKRRIAYILMTIALASIWWFATDIKIIFGNYGNIHGYTDIILSILMIIGFPLFIVALTYRSLKYWKRADINWKSINWMIGGFIWTIISGASCCGATLATSFGLLPLMSFLPYSGLEIKLIGAVWLLFAIEEILKNLETCKIKK
jgi:membrane protease YdiL (CAAX protease family)